MPQIKFGTVVTDMKGKANGSVFSSNRQGAYMRTNKSGGGKKSQSWENSKSRLAFLSTQWKALTLEQREQWNAIAPNYPALNKFNEPYIPSGYQVFMRLNGALYAQDLPLLAVPNNPRSIPAISEIPVYSVDNFCFTPTKTAYLGLISNSVSNRVPVSGIVEMSADKYVNDVSLALISNELNSNASELDNFSLAMRFVLKQNFNFNFGINQAVPLFSVFYENLIKLNVYILTYNDKFSRLVVEFVSENELDDVVVYSAFSFVPNETLKNSFHVGIQSFRESPENTELFLNGNKLTFDNSDWYLINPSYLGVIYVNNVPSITKPIVSTYLSNGSRVLIGSNNKSYFYPYTVSDFRFLNSAGQPDQDCENHEDCGGFAQCYMGICVDGPDIAVPCYEWNFNMWSFGYVVGSETIICGLDFLENNAFVSNVFNSSSFCFYYVTTAIQYSDPVQNGPKVKDSMVVVMNNFTYVPMLYVQSITLEEIGWMVQVSCSGMLSAGRIETQVPYKQIQCVETNKNSTLLSPALRSNYGGFSPNSDFYLKFNLLDSTTGASQNVSIPYVINPLQKRKGPVRFKAGSDLSSSVN